MKKFTALIAIIICAVLCLAAFSGCGSKESSETAGVVNVYNWGEYIDEDIFVDFETETGIKVNYRTFETNEQMYSVLRGGGASYDLIIPSDYMVSRLISEDMLEKLDFSNIPNLELIDDSFKGMEYDPSGEYTVPYMWGIVGIIYNSDIIKDEITSWSALFDEKYKGQILMFDNSRDALGIALKYLGYSLNTTDKAELDEAFALLEEQKPLLQAYVMDQIFDKLESGEAAIGPYYAGDYLTMAATNPSLRFVVPQEGTNRFVDLMCIPKGAENKKNAEIFINYMCSTEISLRNAEYIGYTSPNSEVSGLIELSEDDRRIIYPDTGILDRCEFFVNLPQETLKIYDDYWSKLKA